VRLARRALLVVALLVLLAYAGASLYVYEKQGQIVYAPSRTILKTPKDFGLAYQDLRLNVARAGGASEKIAAWWIPAPRSNGMSLLFLHGNARNMGGNLGKMAALARMGFNVLAIDYRGYGQSDGERPYEAALYEDANAGLDELERREPDLKKRLIHGHSMGGAVAVELAIRRPEAAALFVESSFDSMLGMSTIKAVYRLLPINLLLTERFDSIDRIAQLKLPVLFMHGTADPLVPLTMSERLYAAVTGSKKLVIVSGAVHSNLHEFPQYRDALRALAGLGN